MNFEIFLQQLGVAASSPYAFFSYIFLIAANALVALKVLSNKRLSLVIGKLPPGQRVVAIKELTGEPVPDDITAEEWLRGRSHKYYLIAFLAFVVCATVVVIISLASSPGPRPDWRAHVDEVTIGSNREFVVSLLGEGQRTNISEVLSVPYAITHEVYRDGDSEFQILYRDNVVVGEVIREFNGPTLSKRIQRPADDGSPWVLGVSKFADLRHEAAEIFDNDFNGQSICRIEKHYFGAPGGFWDYYFSHNITQTEGESSGAQVRPDAMLIVNTNELCEVAGAEDPIQECMRMLRMLVCTPSGDFI